MTRTPSSLPARWTFELQSLARIIFGLLLFRHGMEQFAASLELVGGPMLMLGLFTRQVAFLLSGEMAFA